MRIVCYGRAVLKLVSVVLVCLVLLNITKGGKWVENLPTARIGPKASHKEKVSSTNGVRNQHLLSGTSTHWLPKRQKIKLPWMDRKSCTCSYMETLFSVTKLGILLSTNIDISCWFMTLETGYLHYGMCPSMRWSCEIVYIVVFQLLTGERVPMFSVTST